MQMQLKLQDMTACLKNIWIRDNGMKLVAPDYYEKFKCTAGECAHSCCIGWEIDVDYDTLDYYNSIDGEFGQRLRNNIVTEGETAHFCLAENERCPFLNRVYPWGP